MISIDTQTVVAVVVILSSLSAFIGVYYKLLGKVNNLEYRMEEIEKHRNKFDEKLDDILSKLSELDTKLQGTIIKMEK